MKILMRTSVTAMSKSGAIAKAKKHARSLQDTSVVMKGDDYEVINSELLDEFLEDGWTKVASYTYDYDQGKVVRV